MVTNTQENYAMEIGIDQLLGIKAYKNTPSSPRCLHVDDGFIYEDMQTRQVLRCEICGEYYEQRK